MKAKSTLHKQSKPPLQNIAKATPFFQPKLTINQPNDVYEQEADAMADKVMRMEQPGVQLKPLSISTVQRKCTHCEDEEKAQRKEMNEQETHADASLENYVGKLGSSGTPLSNEARSFYEPRFGYDFSQVKIHTDTVAAKSAQSINALAYTSGNNIVFNQGQYAPNTDGGKRLLGHELTHVVQQGGGHNKTVQKKVNVNPIGQTSYVAGLLNQICNNAVIVSSNVISSNCDSSTNKSCDCVCDVVSDPAKTYTINVDPQSFSTSNQTLWNGNVVPVPMASNWPSTSLGTNPTVRIHSPTGRSLALGAFNTTGSAFYYDDWRILAHELCGHARLSQSQGGDRGNRPGHDATIDVENDIAFEHGSSEMRGHFGDRRQGESMWNTVGNNSRVAFYQRNGLHFEAP
jgi:hypothetical protein